MQLTAVYDDIQQKLGGSVQQYDITVKQLTQIEAKLKTVTVNYNNSVKIVKDYETKFAAVDKHVAELTNANRGLTQFKTKVEKDLARDYMTSPGSSNLPTTVPTRAALLLTSRAC